jgi:hypothetical protein
MSNTCQLAPEGPRIVATGEAMPPCSEGIAQPVETIPPKRFRPGGAKESLARRSTPSAAPGPLARPHREPCKGSTSHAEATQ